MARFITVATLNVVSLRTKQRKQLVLDVLLRNNVAIACLQETKIETKEEEKEAAVFFSKFYQFIASNGVNGRAGVAVLVRRCPEIVIVPDLGRDDAGRVSAVDCLIGSNLFRVLSIYAPNEAKERREFFEYLGGFFNTSAMILLAGDFNCVLKASDRQPGSSAKDSSVNALKEICRTASLVDMAEATGAKKLRFTHWQSGSQARLDRIYISSEIEVLPNTVETTPVPFSDHGIVVARVPTSLKGTGRSPRNTCWKFNDSLLEDESFCKDVSKSLLSLWEQGAPDACAWEEFKHKFRVMASEEGKKRQARRREALRNQEQQLRLLVEQEELEPGRWLEEVKSCKKQFLQVLKERFKGAVVRSREQVLASDEQPTRVFLTLEKERQKRNSIRQLKHEDVLLEDQAEIQNAFVEEYTALLGNVGQQTAETVPRLEQSLRCTVEEYARDQTNGPITVQEIETSIKAMNVNKAPGADGIGNSFYKAFLSEVAPILAKVYEDIFRRKRLPPSMSQACVILLPKKSSGVPSVKDFRPISLLCSDYKILARILARRLQLSLRSVIGEHQAYGFKGRSLAQNLHIMRTVCDASEASGNPAAVLQIDLSKAFDRVKHDFLFSLLRCCNVGETLYKWITLCYTDISSRLIVNGVKTKNVPVKCSVRQGCPMSPVLFALYVEPLCQRILHDRSITGLVTAVGEVKLLCYADDVAVITSTKKQVFTVLDHVRQFCVDAGAMLNMGKTSGTWLGEWGSTPSNFAGATWHVGRLKYLGVTFDNSASLTAVWADRVAAVRAKAAAIRGRELTLLNRSYVCNTVLYPRMWYRAQALPCNVITIQKMHRVFATTVWGSSFEKMSRDCLFLGLKRGGFGLVNISLKLLVHRFFYFLRTKHAILRWALQTLGACQLSQWTVSCSDSSTIGATNVFYKEVAFSISFFCQRFSWEYLTAVKRKRLYWDAVTSVFPVPRYWQPVPKANEKDVLCRLRAYPVSPATKDVFVRFLTESLSTRVWMDKKGFSLVTTKCPWCPCEEDVRHLFLECRNAECLWFDIEKCLECRLNVSWEGLKFLVSKVNLPGQSMEILMLVGLHSLWKARTDVVECKQLRKHHWSHLVAGLQWTLSVLGNCPDREDESQVLEKCIRDPWGSPNARH